MIARRVVVSAVLLAVGVLGSIAQPASAAVLTHRFKAAGTSVCLDASNDVRLATCGPANRQLWRWSTPSSGGTLLQNVGTGTCADRFRADVGLSGCGSGVPNRWLVTGTPDNLLIKAADTGLCLSRTGSAQVGMKACDGTPGQRWQRA
ncbi:RICIN domain-containing protein [Lentzea sp. NPDC051213]|uniref:RICIN domain-containing protein n=1 Tax=Lentzea sp. NPDC051213 TaxID=3364126 RepID=UPI00378AC3AD